MEESDINQTIECLNAHVLREPITVITNNMMKCDFKLFKLIL